MPKLADATLVRPAQVKFPVIPGVTYTGLATTYPLLDWGPQYKAQDETGIATQLPPAYLGKDYAIFVPRLTATATTSPASAPRMSSPASAPTPDGTWTGRPAPVIDNGGLFGSYFPYKKTLAERQAVNDPRPSLTERYGTQAGYVAAVTAAANSLVTRRFMLQVDADAAIAAAKANIILP